jgi:hypothetical protein
MSIQLEVVHGDALDYPTDVLALKFAQDLYGVDAKVVTRLASNGIRVKSRLPEIGKSLLISSERAVAAREILFLGVEPLGRFDYETIRRFAHSVLLILSTNRPSMQHMAMTLHGRGFGLDEAEAFRSEIAGVLDAVAAHDHPKGLARISIVESDAEAAKRLISLLATILPSGIVSDTPSRFDPGSVALGDARAHLGTVGHDSREKSHVFVAMPFAEEYADRFHYGIRGAANATGFLCERADLASFTGDVLEWVKDRIGSAALVVADLTAANPNVYLEVGYAWGRGVRTVLVVEGDELKFDVRTQRCLVFHSIRHLEELLTNEFTALKADGS